MAQQMTQGLLLCLIFTLLCCVSFVVAQNCEQALTQGTTESCGDSQIDREECQRLGCCFRESAGCFRALQAETFYRVLNVTQQPNGYTAFLAGSGSCPYGEVLPLLRMDVFFQTQTRLHVKFTDALNERWEVPDWIIPRSDPSQDPSVMDYSFSYTEFPFGFAVVRVSTGEVLFNTTPAGGNFNGLTFADQYLEMSTQTEPNPYIYGLGERAAPFLLNTNGGLYTMWASDHATPEYQNLYGSYPFYLHLKPSGNAHGVFLLNSNGMDVYTGNSMVTYHVIGGVLDFYIYTGPTPADVISDHQSVIGYPYLPPYWGLGWHQCRWGYSSIYEVEQVVQNYSNAEIPLDTMWNDIDYMDSYMDFTFSPDNFPPSVVNDFVTNTLHANGQHYVVITDPGIHNASGYAPAEDLLAAGCYIHQSNATTDPFIGMVWPGSTAFPDFTHPNAPAWWTTQVKSFLGTVPIDGLWIDMNEPSNFCDGICGPEDDVGHVKKARLSDGSTFDPNNPPYAINNMGDQAALDSHTIPMDTFQYGDNVHYNVHNLYGITEGIATATALQTVRGTRQFIIGRSTFSSSGSHQGHWLGDNYSDWLDLYLAIPGILNFQMFGITLVGADICGFGGNTTEELCGRWMQIGSFYPFSRNHNSIGQAPQEPYRWESVANISRTVLAIKYSMIPYYYTLFHAASTMGGTVWRPLLFEFTSDQNTWSLDQQVLVGPAVMLSPVLTQGATTVSAYFPEATWYDYYTQQTVGAGQQTLNAPFEVIPIHLRGGYVIPTQAPELTTTATRENPFTLIVTLDGTTGGAQGMLYWDDGESLDVGNNYLLVNFTCDTNDEGGSLSATGFYGFNANLNVDTVQIWGASSVPHQATLNGQYLSGSQISYNNNVVTFSSLGASVSSAFTLVWSQAA